MHAGCRAGLGISHTLSQTALGVDRYTFQGANKSGADIDIQRLISLFSQIRREGALRELENETRPRGRIVQ